MCGGGGGGMVGVCGNATAGQAVWGRNAGKLQVCVVVVVGMESGN